MSSICYIEYTRKGPITETAKRKMSAVQHERMPLIPYKVRSREATGRGQSLNEQQPYYYLKTEDYIDAFFILP